MADFVHSAAVFGRTQRIADRIPGDTRLGPEVALSRRMVEHDGGRTLTPPYGTRLPDARTLTPKEQALLDEVEPRRLRESVEWLTTCAAVTTRLSSSLTARYVDEMFSRSYPGQSRIVTWERDGKRTETVVCTRSGPSPEELILCAPHDLALGADALDNATGVAALLELARVVSGFPLFCSLRFVCCTRLPNGALTPHEYGAGDAPPPVRLVLHLDMNGAPVEPGASAVVVEQHGGSSAQDLMALVAGPAATYARVLARAEPAADAPKRSIDSPHRTDFEYLARITRMTLATVLLAGRAGAPQ